MAKVKVFVHTQWHARLCGGYDLSSPDIRPGSLKIKFIMKEYANIKFLSLTIPQLCPRLKFFTYITQTNDPFFLLAVNSDELDSDVSAASWPCTNKTLQSFSIKPHFISNLKIVSLSFQTKITLYNVINSMYKKEIVCPTCNLFYFCWGRVGGGGKERFFCNLFSTIPGTCMYVKFRVRQRNFKK